MEGNSSPQRLVFFGDICLARSLYGESADSLVDTAVSRDLCRDSLVVANMESVLRDYEDVDCDHLDFQGDPKLLSGLDFVDVFGLANNHINDFGDDGIRETIEAIEQAGFDWCGVNAYISEMMVDGFKVAVIFASDMMNKAFDESQTFSTLDLYSGELENTVELAAQSADFTILYVHTGLLFCPFPSMKLRRRLLQLTTEGVAAIITAHSHCAGGIEWSTNGVPIIYSLGDTIMDGASFRRRRSFAAELQFSAHGVAVKLLDLKFKGKALELAGRVHKIRAALNRVVFTFIMILPLWIYSGIYNWLYRLSMLFHISSTLRYLVYTLGLSGTIRRLALRRTEVFRFASWLRRDRKASSTDYDAILPNRKVIKAKDLK